MLLLNGFYSFNGKTFETMINKLKKLLFIMNSVLKILWISCIIIKCALCQDLPKLNPLSVPKQLSVNGRARILCVASSGDQPIDFNWLRNGQPFDFGKIEQLDEWTSSLTIHALSLEHNGNYSCRASNALGDDRVTSVLFVSSPPQWVIEPLDIKVGSGRNAMIHCKAEGYPRAKITWHRKSESHQKVIIRPSNHFQLFENGSLLITNAQKSNSGVYECEASNGFGNNLRKSIELIVYETPSVERIVDHLVVEKGQAVQLSCLAKGDPPLSFEWIKNKKEFNLWADSSERISFSELRNTDSIQFMMSLSNTELEDEGIYSCVARNEFGSDSKEIRLTLVERPQSPESVEIVDVWSRSARIRWYTPDNGNSPIQNYTVEYWTSPGGHWNISVGSSALSCILHGLKPATLYNFHVWASNLVGSSEPSQQMHFTTANEEPSGAPVDVKIEETGSTFVRISWKPPPHEGWNGPLSGYYVGYKQSASQLPFTYNTVEADETQSYFYVLRGLRRSTRYLVSVRAFNEVGSGPPTEEIVFKTHSQEALPQPTLLVQDIGSTYIQINWMMKEDYRSVTSGYAIHYRKSGGRWNEVVVPDPHQNMYMLTNLDSGVPYQVYITSHGHVGISEPSEIATVRTSPEAIFHQPAPPPAQTTVDDATQIFYIVIPVAVATVIIVIVIVSACVYVYSKRPLPPISTTYGDLPASKNFHYMATAPRQRDIPSAICGGGPMKYGSPYSTVPLTRPEEDEPIYESVHGDTLRKIKERSFDDDFRLAGATVV